MSILSVCVLQAVPTGMAMPHMQPAVLQQDGTQRASGGKSKTPYPNYWGANP